MADSKSKVLKDQLWQIACGSGLGRQEAEDAQGQEIPTSRPEDLLPFRLDIKFQVQWLKRWNMAFFIYLLSLCVTIVGTDLCRVHWHWPRSHSVTGASRPSISHLSCDPKRPKTLGCISEEGVRSRVKSTSSNNHHWQSYQVHHYSCYRHHQIVIIVIALEPWSLFHEPAWAVINHP